MPRMTHTLIDPNGVTHTRSSKTRTYTHVQVLVWMMSEQYIRERIEAIASDIDRRETLLTLPADRSGYVREGHTLHMVKGLQQGIEKDRASLKGWRSRCPGRAYEVISWHMSEAAAERARKSSGRVLIVALDPDTHKVDMSGWDV